MSRFSRKQIVALSVAALAIAAIAIAAISVCCSHHTYPRELVVADSLCESNPPKAISYLKALRVKSKSMGTADSWYYRLLCVKARDKAYIPATDVKEAQTIVNHYESFGADKSKLQYAYYYLGCAYRDLNNIPMALEFYKKALNIVADKNSKFASAVNFQTGFQLLEQSFYKEAMNYFRESLRIETMQHNSAMMAYCLQKIAYVYQEEKNDSCFLYYKEALNIAQKSNDMQVCNGMKSSLANYYVEKAEYEKAKDLSLPVIHTMSDDNNAKDSFYDVAGLSYLGLGRLDSALYFFNELNKTEKIKTKVESSRQLAHIYNIKGDSKRSLMYMAEYEQAADSLKKINVESSIAKMNALYDYTMYKERNAALERSHYRMLVAMCIVVMLSLYGLFYFIVFYRKMKRRVFIQKLNWERYQDEIKERNDNNIKDRDETIKNLLSQLQEMKDRSTAANDIAPQADGNTFQQDIIAKKYDLEKEVLKSFMASDIFQVISQKVAINENLTNKELEALDEPFLMLIPDFIKNLKSSCHLSVQDIRMCALIRISSFNSSEIAALLGRDKSTISKAKKKLLLAFVGKNSKDIDFNEYIRTL